MRGSFQIFLFGQGQRKCKYHTDTNTKLDKQFDNNFDMGIIIGSIEKHKLPFVFLF